MRVLAVEDDPEFREFLSFHLSSQGGIEIEVAATGEEALAALSERAPDVLVVDVNMSEMGGEELARRARERHPAIKVVSFSGSGGDTPWADQTIVKGGRESLTQLVEAIRALAEEPARDR
ncbi:MAG TPA: response regulator [Actinomycetota bacterium]|nr:response regulator [Actinomycetota bacterium]